MIAVFRTVTTLGSTAFILPAAMLMLLWLLAAQSARAGLHWVAALATCGIGTAALKLCFITCPDTALDLRSPSGHAAIATFFYGALMLVAAPLQDGWRRIALATAAPCIIALVVASRLVLGAHSLVEAAIGTAVGLLSLAFFARLYRPVAPVRPTPWLLPLAAVVLPLAWGRYLPIEPAMYWLAMHLRGGLGVCT
jgi:membrane-associated phospholipid phosphatase